MDYSDLVTLVRDSFTGLTAWLRAQQPRLLSAAALLAFGWVLAVVLRLVASRLVQALGRLIPRRVLRRGLPQLGIERQVSDLIGLVVFWVVLLFFAAAAADALGIGVLSASLAGLGFYLPRLVGSILIGVFGLVIGNLAREAVAAASPAPFATTAGRIARTAILILAALIAVAELGIDITLLTAVLSVTLLTVLGAFALAFGLGARTAVSNIIGAHYLRQTVETGQHVRIGDIEGTITSITATALVVRVPEGEVVIPAKQFNESVSVLLASGGAR